MALQVRRLLNGVLKEQWVLRQTPGGGLPAIQAEGTAHAKASSIGECCVARDTPGVVAQSTRRGGTR